MDYELWVMWYGLKYRTILVVIGLLLSLNLQAARFPSFTSENERSKFASEALVRGGLKPGTYYNLKPTEPLVLDTGSYTFIGLEMNCMVPTSGVRGPWLDARKAVDFILAKPA